VRAQREAYCFPVLAGRRGFMVHGHTVCDAPF
jgi:hypothetical protein